MSTLVTADLHLNNNSRDSYRHAFIGELIELIKAHKVDTLLVLGDLTHEKDCHNAELVNAIINTTLYILQSLPVLKGNSETLVQLSPPRALNHREHRAHGEPPVLNQGH